MELTRPHAHAPPSFNFRRHWPYQSQVGVSTFQRFNGLSCISLGAHGQCPATRVAVEICGTTWSLRTTEIQWATGDGGGARLCLSAPATAAVLATPEFPSLVNLSAEGPDALGPYLRLTRCDDDGNGEYSLRLQMDALAPWRVLRVDAPPDLVTLRLQALTMCGEQSGQRPPLHFELADGESRVEAAGVHLPTTMTLTMSARWTVARNQRPPDQVVVVGELFIEGATVLPIKRQVVI
jgi:hypothetical protein